MGLQKYFVFISVILSLYTTACTTETRLPTQKQPNIVFFFIDDMGWRDWSGNGSDFLLTPSIDRIAKEGIVFEQGYVNAANCAPSRCALLSGQYPPRNHFYNVWSIHRGNPKTDRLSLKDVPDKQVLPDKRVTFAEAMKKVGYATAMYGKWHVSGDGKFGSGTTGGVSPQMQGFDDVLEHGAGDLGKMFKKNKDPKQIYSYTKKAMDFAEKCHKENKPFLIYLAHHAVHMGYEYRPESLELYKNKKEGQINRNPKYGAMMHDTDRSIGQMLDKLKKLNIEKNTVVIFLSDNGGIPTHCTQPPLRAYKGSYYEGGIRVPFMIRWPGTLQPGKNHTPVMAIDLYPTMLELAGVTDIKKHLNGYPIDGNSIVPLLKNETLKERSLFWHFPAYLSGSLKYTGGRSKQYRQQPVTVIRKGDWKLHLYLEEWSLDGGRAKITSNNSVELYNLKNDIGEKNNLALTNTKKRDELLDELLAWQQQIKAPIPKEANPQQLK